MKIKNLSEMMKLKIMKMRKGLGRVIQLTQFVIVIRIKQSHSILLSLQGMQEIIK